MIWMILDLVLQGCTDSRRDVTRISFDDPTPVFSQFISIYATAIVFLQSYGIVTDVRDNGGRVVSGKMLPLIECAKILKTGIYSDKPQESAATQSDVPRFS